MTSKFLLTAAVVSLFGASALAAPEATEELPASAPEAVEATTAQLSSTEVEAVLSSAASVPPNCEVYEFNGVCTAVVCQEDDPITPWFDPMPVFYECSEFGL